MKSILFSITLLAISLNVHALKVRFTTANMSTNVAEGTISIFTSFKLFPDDFENTDSLNAIDFVDFSTIAYDDIVGVVIEKTILNSQNTAVFNRMATFVMTDSSTNGNFTDNDILQGATYVFRLVVTDKNGQSFNLLNRELTTQLANPSFNCAKLNNVYRLAGHNNFQESIVDPDDGGFYQSLFYTRVVELDAHASNNPTTWNWSVRHVDIGFLSPCSGNCNNCGYNPSTGKADGDKPFGICIDDLKRWHNNHPNHDPIILFIDLKSEWNKNNNGQTPADLDQRLLSLVPNPNMIYKPRDLIGNNFNNMRAAAQLNNLPSMGDLMGKFIFALTGDGAIVSEYIRSRSLDAVAFSAAKVNNIGDVNDLTRSTPSIGTGLENDIVFYNMQLFNDVPFSGGDVAAGTSLFVYDLNYMSRVYGGGNVGQPGNFSFTNFFVSTINRIHNIAIANINLPILNPNDFILFHKLNNVNIPFTTTANNIGQVIVSNHSNVTDAAINNITATNLTVEPDAHYRMIAGNSIDLQPGVDIKQGSDVDIRIDDCRFTDYTQRKNTQTGKQLTQEEIDKLMHELNKELYGYQPESEKEIVNLTVYPNPTSNSITISYTQFLKTQGTFTLYDITGRVVKTQQHTPQTEGRQQLSITIAELKEGTYFYTLQVGEQTYNSKVIKINQ